MDARDMRELLDGYLRDAGWSKGVTHAELVGMVQDDDALSNVIGQYVAIGVYHGPDEVLNVIPAQAWQDAQGDRWGGGVPPDDAQDDSGYAESPAG